MNLPSSNLPTPVRIRGRTSAETDLVESTRGAQARSRRSTVPEDVWSIVQEFKDKGGLYDLAVQVARLEAEYEAIDKMAEENNIYALEAHKLRVKLSAEIAKTQAKAMDVTLKMKSVITDDGLRVILETMLNSMQQHGCDPHIIKKVGQDLAVTLRAVKQQVKG